MPEGEKDRQATSINEQFQLWTTRNRIGLGKMSAVLPGMSASVCAGMEDVQKMCDWGAWCVGGDGKVR